jgi:hypothetical protein
MRLLYCGSPECTQETFKRLLLVADEVAFADRPALMFSNWGLIGRQSWLRQIAHLFENKPVNVTVYPSPGGPVTGLYERYVQADLADREFRKVVLAGLGSNKPFTEKFYHTDTKYAAGSSREIIAALRADADLAGASLPTAEVERPGFEVQTPAGRRDMLRMLLVDVSVQVTNATVMALEHGYQPVTDDSVTAHLLAMRMSGGDEGATDTLTPFLGVEITKAAIPDAALQKLTILQILNYRAEAKDVYAAWAAELDALAAEIEGLDPSGALAGVRRLVAATARPRLAEYENELRSISERLFGDLIKRVVTLELPCLSAAYLFHLGFWGAAAALLAPAGRAVPPLVDFVQARRDLARRNGASYLVGLARRARKRR